MGLEILNSTFLQACLLIFGFIVTSIPIFWIYYFGFGKRKDQLSESYPYEFSLTLLKRKDDNLLHFLLDVYRKAFKMSGKQTFVAPFPFLPAIVCTNDPKNVEYILKTNFENYEKGPAWYVRMKDVLGEGIFSSDGDTWYRHRKTSAKLFNLNIFRGIVMYQFNDHMDKVLNIIADTKGKVFDFQDLMFRFTLDSISKIAFGQDVGSLESKAITFARDFDYAQKVCCESFIDPLWYLKRLFTAEGREFFASIRRLDELAYRIIRQRRADELARTKNRKDKDESVTKKGGMADQHEDEYKYDGDDLVSLYLNREDEDGKLSDKNLRDIILNLLIAGRDTTAQALSWSIYRLCIHPDIQQKIREEAIFHLSDLQTTPSDELKTGPNFNNSSKLDQRGWPTFETISNLKYIEAFCLEVIRLHPSVPKEAKFAKKDDVFPDNTVIKKGDQICFCPWIMARTESLWTNCEEFNPERFIDKPRPSPFVYTSFLAGPRTCLGQNLALLEMKCCLARLLMSYEFTLGQDPATVTYQNTLTHPILGGLKVIAKPIQIVH